MSRFIPLPRAIDVPRVPGFSEDCLQQTIMHPVQFHGLWSGVRRTPECEIALAVLECAVSDLRRFRFARGRRRQRLYVQAYQWVASDARDWPFSFVNLCEYLHLSPQALREQMLGDGREPAFLTAA